MRSKTIQPELVMTDFNKRQSQEINISQIRFLGEQVGPPEQLLKQKLSEFFRRDRIVRTAYLAKADIGNSVSVMLCLNTRFGEDKGLAEKIGIIFKAMFNEETYLDILFLNENREKELKEVCPNFFSASKQ